MRPPHLAPALAALALLAAAHAVSACPGSTYYYGALDPANPILVVTASHDTSFSTNGCDQVSGHYAIDTGVLIATLDHACSAESGSPPSGLETVIEDDFTVTGIADGTPVSFTAVLDLAGEVAGFSPPEFGAGGRLRGLIREGASSPVSVLRTTTNVSSSVTVSESLLLPVNGVAGSPLHLRFAVRAEALDAHATLKGTLRFGSLPANAVVRSCRGYASDSPVGARTTSWGGLKSIYR